MKKMRIRGFIDPITLGFLLAISSTATILKLDSNATVDHSQVSANETVTVQVQNKGS